MSQWKWNDIELEVDMTDVDFQEGYEKAFEKMELSEKELQKIGSLSEITNAYCVMFWELFDNIFGPGTADKLFKGKKSSRLCDEVYLDFIQICRQQVLEEDKRRNTMLNKFKPNRQQRRAKK